MARRFMPAAVLVVLLALGVAWRLVRYLLAFPFWGDESFVAINFVTRDFATIVRPLEWGQIAPLGFMWAELAISRVAGLGEWSLRLLPLLSGLASLAVFTFFARTVLPRRAAVLAVGILAAAYYVVRHSSEVKPYATDLLVALLLTVLAWRVWTAPRSGAAWAGLIVAAGLAVWCSYPAAFVGGSIGLLLVALVRREQVATGRAGGLLGGLLLYGLVFLGSFAVMYVVYAKPHAAAAAGLMETMTWTPAFPPLGEPWKLPLWLAWIHTGLMLAYPHGGTAPGSSATLILVIAGAVHLWRTRQRALLWLLLGPLTLTFVAAALKAYPYGGSARTSLYMAPAFCLLAGLGAWVLILRLAAVRVRRHVFNAGVIGLVLIPVVGMIADIRKPYSSTDARDIRARIRGLAAQTGAEDRWITFNAAEPKDYAPWLGDWRGTGGQFVFDLARLCPVELVWAPVPEGLDVRAAGGRVWLFAYRGIRVEFPQAQFDAYFQRLEQVLGPADWHEQTVLKERDGRLEAIDVWRFDPAGG